MCGVPMAHWLNYVLRWAPSYPLFGKVKSRHLGFGNTEEPTGKEPLVSFPEAMYPISTSAIQPIGSLLNDEGSATKVSLHEN
jgi:hypothetical protein